MQDFMDLDTHEKVHYLSESSNASQTSGYSTMSPGGAGGTMETGLTNSPSISPNSIALQGELSNLHLPPTGSGGTSSQYQIQPQYTQLQNASAGFYLGSMQQQQQQQQQTFQGMNQQMSMSSQAGGTQRMDHYGSGGLILSSIPKSGMPRPIKEENLGLLVILEQPVEKFRFRYKSEMHGTHGSLNGANSKRTPKTFPEVELQRYNGKAIIRCSLFQTTLESPHSHQLVVRNDDADICDPHEVRVSPQDGFVARFQNMGIIHTAKKYIYDELLRKKRTRMLFELGREELSTKQEQELDKQTKREEKDMNLNQVRLCFEAFKEEDDHTYTQIAAPVYSHPINNRKSAQTGELRICRLSHTTGCVSGGDDLILLVEKVSKKNIKVRFYEMNDEDGLIWEAYAKFRESDVHHQYAIVCQTPPYRNKDIEQSVEVYVELIRPSDDERSFPPRTFRYKPRQAVVSRKRRRTCNSSSTGSMGSSSSSFELPRPVQEKTGQIGMGGMITSNANTGGTFATPGPSTNQSTYVCQGVIPSMDHHSATNTAGHMTIGSQDFNKSEELNRILGSETFQTFLTRNSEELEQICINPSFLEDLETDGLEQSISIHTEGRRSIKKHSSSISQPNLQNFLQRIFQIYDVSKHLRSSSSGSGSVISKENEQQFTFAAERVAGIFNDYTERTENGDTLLHEIILNDTSLRSAMLMCHILNYFELTDLLNRCVNVRGESALHCACIQDRQHYIRPLLSLGCDPNLSDRHGNTALHVAVREQHQKCIDAIINVVSNTTITSSGSVSGSVPSSANKNVISLNMRLKNDEGLTPLHLAIRLGNGSLAEKLIALDRLAAAQVPQSKDGNTALHMAIQKNSLPLVRGIMHEQTPGSNVVRSILRISNAAGHNALELARILCAGTSKVTDNNKSSLFDYLQKMAGTVDDADTLWIKEEDMSSSSPTDDEDDDQQHDGIIENDDAALELLKIPVKMESDEDDNHEQHLDQLLNDAKRFQDLIEHLNVSEKWRKFAALLKIQHLMCLWSNAEDMLRYVQKKAADIKYQDFDNALQAVVGVKRANQLLL